MRASVRAVIRTICLAALVAGASAPAWAQQTLSFVFVAPTDVIVNNFGAASAKGGFATGYRGVIITAANTATFKKVAPENMRKTFEALQPGTPLRAKVDQVMKASHGLVFDVRVHLVDDLSGLPVDNIYADDIDETTKLRYVWPAAWSEPVTTPRKGHMGTIGIGETAAAQEISAMGSWAGWESVILHETLHTQFVGEHTKWGSISITYGMDENHYFSEILGAQDLPFEEGLGTFYGYTHYDPDGYNKTNKFFSRADERYLVEDGSIPRAWDELRNAPHTKKEVDIPEAVKKEQPDRKVYTRYQYTWKNVPGKDLLFNEWTSCAFHIYFWKHANNDQKQALQMIDENASSQWSELKRRYPAWAANNLALQLEKFAATAEGQAKKTAGTLTSSMFPIALLDLITHFGMTDADFQIEFKRQESVSAGPSKALAQYFATHRPAIKALVDADLKATPIRFEQAVKAIHTYFQKPDTILTP